MTASFVQRSALGATGGGTVPGHASAAAGDDQILFVCTHQSITPTTPSGWTLLDRFTSAHSGMSIFTRVASSGNATSGQTIAWGDYGRAELRTYRGGTGFTVKNNGTGLVTAAESFAGILLHAWGDSVNPSTGGSGGNTLTPDVALDNSTGSITFQWYAGLVVGDDPSSGSSPARTATDAGASGQSLYPQWVDVQYAGTPAGAHVRVGSVMVKQARRPPPPNVRVGGVFVKTARRKGPVPASGGTGGWGLLPYSGGDGPVVAIPSGVIVGGLAIETDTAFAGTVNVDLGTPPATIAGGSATEADTGLAGGTNVLVAGGIADEADVALAGGGVISGDILTGGAAIERSVGLAGLIVTASQIQGGTATEADTGRAGVVLVGTTQGGFARETDTALGGTVQIAEGISAGFARVINIGLPGKVIRPTSTPLPGGGGGGGGGTRGAGLVRWTLFDPSTSELWVFPRNPNKMTSPHPPKTTTIFARNFNFDDDRLGVGRVLQFREDPYDWQFSGDIRTEEHYEAFRDWSRRTGRLRLTDHLDRAFEIRFDSVDITEEKPTFRHGWRYSYTAKAIIYGRVA